MNAKKSIILIWLRTAFVTLLVTAGVSPAASAAHTTFVSVSAGANSDSTSGAGPLLLSISGAGLEGLGVGGASALADFGSLGVRATGHATPASAFPTIVSSADASFTDLLFIAGPDGPVNLTFSLELLGGCFATDGATAGFPNALCRSAAGSLAVPGAGVSVGGTKPNGSVTITWVGNSALGISGDLNTSGYAWNGSYDANYIDTLHTFVMSSTPGVVITSESGHDYSPTANVVPIPAAGWLFGSGLLGLIGVARRKI